MKILHFADLHLDRSFADLGLSQLAGKAHRERLIEIFKQIFAMARVKSVDAVTIAGDLFEQDTVMPATLKILSEEFEQIAPVPVLIVSGQADAYSGQSLYSRWNFPTNVHIFSSQTLSAFQLSPGISVWGASCPYTPFDLLEAQTEPDGLNLLLLHKINDQSEKAIQQSLKSKALKNRNIDFSLLGGEHQYQTFPGGVMPGSPELIEPETQNVAHGVGLITIEQGNIQSEFIKIGSAQHSSIEVDLSGCENMDEVEHLIAQAIGSQVEQLFYRVITLIGTPQCIVDTSHLGDVIDGHTKFITQLNMSYDLDTLAKEPTVRGVLASQFMGHIEKLDTENQSRTLNVLHIALQALDGSKEIINATESD